MAPCRPGRETGPDDLEQVRQDIERQDVGTTLRVKVTAKNPDGETEAYSAVTPVVAAASPTVSSVMAISTSSSGFERKVSAAARTAF